MELAKIIGVGLVTAIAALILKSSKPELAFAVTIAGGVIILIFALDMLGASLRIFTDIAEKTSDMVEKTGNTHEMVSQCHNYTDHLQDIVHQFTLE